MKVLLIDPKPRIFAPSRYVPLGLAYLASCVERAGHDVSVVDLNVEPKTKLDFDVDVVGITATTPLIEEAWKLTELFKEHGDPVTVFGGYHPTFLPEESLSKPTVDVVVRFEGEQTMVELLDRLEKGRPLRGVKGISYKNGNKIVHTPNRPLLKNLDSLPYPSYHLFRRFPEGYSTTHPLLEPRKRTATMITSRGCPWACTFCGKFSRMWRPRLPEKIVEEWRWLIDEWKIRDIGTVDDCWSLKVDRAKEICRLIIKEGLELPWTTISGMRVDCLDRELLTLMKRSGCHRVSFGVEQGNPVALKKLGKGITLQQAERAFKLTKEIGIQTIAFFVLGMPWETRETMLDSINFAKKLNPDFVQFTIADPIPGSDLFEHVKKYGRFLSSSWSEYGFREGKMLFEVKGLSPKLVEEMFAQAYKSFYLRPSYVFNRLTDKNTYLNLVGSIRGAFHFLLGLKD